MIKNMFHNVSSIIMERIVQSTSKNPRNADISNDALLLSYKIAYYIGDSHYWEESIYLIRETDLQKVIILNGNTKIYGISFSVSIIDTLNAKIDNDAILCILNSLSFYLSYVTYFCLTIMSRYVKILQSVANDRMLKNMKRRS